MSKIKLTLDADVEKIVSLHENDVLNREESIDLLNKFSKEDLIEQILGKEDYYDTEDDEDDSEDNKKEESNEKEEDNSSDDEDDDEDYDIL